MTKVKKQMFDYVINYLTITWCDHKYLQQH